MNCDIDHSMPVRSLCFSKDNLLYSGSGDKNIFCDDIRTIDSAVIRTFTGHSGWVVGVSISPDGQYLISW